MKSIIRTAFIIFILTIYSSLIAQSSDRYNTAPKALELEYTRNSPEAMRLITQSIDESIHEVIFEKVRSLNSNGQILLTYKQYNNEKNRYTNLTKQGNTSLKKLKYYIYELEHTYVIVEEFVKRNSK